MKNRFRPQDQEGSQSFGILEPEEPINSLRGVECTMRKSHWGLGDTGNWYSSTDFGLAGSRQGYSQALMALSCFPSTTPAWRKQGANGFSVPPLVSRDLGSP